MKNVFCRRNIPFSALLSIIFVLQLISHCFLSTAAKGMDNSKDSLSGIGKESDSENKGKNRPKIGLVLSGGGAKGLAHIGVLKVIEEAGVQVDIVTGTSMGSIVGGLYAIGYSPEQIEDIILDIDWLNLFRDRYERGNLSMERKRLEGRYLASFRIRNWRLVAPSGLVEGQKIFTLLSSLTYPVCRERDFTEFTRPFSCVATDIASGEAVVIDSGYLPEAMRASMAFPSIFTPIKINGRILLDGGFARNLPAEDAMRLGADIVIGVDVTAGVVPADSIESIFDVLNQFFGLIQAQKKQKQQKLCDILITPDVEEISIMRFDKADEIIRRGEIAAREAMERLTELTDSLPWVDSQRPRERITFSDVSDTILVSEIEIRGLKKVPSKLVWAELRFKAPCRVTAKSLGEVTKRLHGSGFFRHVSWRLEPLGEGSRLVILVREESNDYFRVGLHYDSYWRSALMLNLSFRNLIGHGSNLSFDLTMSEFTRFNSAYSIHTGVQSQIGLEVKYTFIDDKIDFYKGSRRVASTDVKSHRIGVYLKSFLSRILYGSFGIEAEWSRETPRIATVWWENNEMYAMLEGEFILDTVDRVYFPDRGISLRLSGCSAERKLGSDIDFERAFGDLKFYIPVGRKFTILGGIQGGSTRGEKVPGSYLFYLGGMNSSVIFQDLPSVDFLGLDHQELAGRNVFSALIGLRYELRSRLYVTLRYNEGNTSEERRNLFVRDDIVKGGGVTIGINTPAGPVEGTIASGTGHELMVFFSIGCDF